MNDFEKVINRLKNNLKDRELGFNFEYSVKLMETHIRKAYNDEDIGIYSEDTNIIKNSMTNLLLIALNGNISSILDILSDYTELCSNWNKLSKSKEISSLVRAISNLVNYHNKVLEMIDINKELRDKVNTTNNFSPPTYQIKKQYFRQLEEIYEGSE